MMRQVWRLGSRVTDIAKYGGYTRQIYKQDGQIVSSKSRRMMMTKIAGDEQKVKEASSDALDQKDQQTEQQLREEEEVEEEETWEWIPPVAIEHKPLMERLSERYVREEDVAGDLDFRDESELVMARKRKKAQEWTFEAERYLDMRSYGFKPLVGQPFQVDEIKAFLKVHGLTDVMHFDVRETGVVGAEVECFIIGTAASSSQIEKLCKTMSFAIKKRRKHPREPVSKASIDREWGFVKMGAIEVNIMLKEIREFMDLESKWSPDRIDHQYLELLKDVENDPVLFPTHERNVDPEIYDDLPARVKKGKMTASMYFYQQENPKL